MDVTTSTVLHWDLMRDIELTSDIVSCSHEPFCGETRKITFRDIMVIYLNLKASMEFSKFRYYLCLVNGCVLIEWTIYRQMGQ